MAQLSVEVDDVEVLALLREKRGLETGRELRDVDVEFSAPVVNGAQTVSVTLTYSLSAEEVDQLVR